MRLIVNDKQFGFPSNGNLILPITRADQLDSNFEVEPEFKAGYRELFMNGWDPSRRDLCSYEAAQCVRLEISAVREIGDFLAKMDNTTPGRTGFVNLYYGWITQECLDQPMLVNDDDIIRPVMEPVYKYTGRLIQLTEPLKIERDEFPSFATESNFYKVRQLIACISDRFEQYPRFQSVTSEINTIARRVYSGVLEAAIGCMLYFGEPMNIEYKQPAPVEKPTKPKKIVVSPWL